MTNNITYTDRINLFADRLEVEWEEGESGCL